MRHNFNIAAKPTDTVTIIRHVNDWPDWYGYLFVMVVLVSAVIGAYA